VKTGRLPFGIGLMAFALVTGACAPNAPLDTLRPAGPIARQIDGLWDVVFYAAVAVFVVVEGLLVIALIRFRQRKGDTEAPAQVHGNTRMEVAWTIAPALLMAVLAVPTVLTIFALAREPEGALQVNVTGQQWWWGYEYREAEVFTANDLHIPAGRPVRLILNTKDIIHSFWVPRPPGNRTSPRAGPTG
jgi:cytochrome c oxidase subunit 2